MNKKPIKEWFAEHDRFFEDPMRAICAGYTVDELRDYYGEIYLANYAEWRFQKDLEILAVRAYNGG